MYSKMIDILAERLGTIAVGILSVCVVLFYSHVATAVVNHIATLVGQAIAK